ncbi:phage tail length tape measure family protein [Nitratireductor rhodophyticola]|uniref:phage tail length tape measure family protein n=1 Tax=Nitratireductor rhodophyticola TaxID=2854036 RepID=UPI00300A548C
MAEISEKLLVAIEVTQRRVEKQLDRIAKQAAKAAKGMEDDFSRANKRIVAGAGQAATALERINKTTGVDRGAFSGDRARDVAEFGRELDRLRARYNPLYAASKRYEAELDELNRALTVGAISADEHGAALNRLNGRYQAMTAQGAAATSVFRANRFETANVAAQLNDIGVQLAGGQSPFLIAVQQGTQLNQIFGAAGGLRGSLGLLAGAFGSLLNPISLATIGIIGLGGTAVQYFTSLISDGEKSEDTLERQTQLIEQVAEQWGGAVPALREYVDELRRARDVGQLSEATQAAINARFSELDTITTEAKTAVGAVISELVRAGQADSQIRALSDAFNETDRATQDLNTALLEGKDTTEAFERFSASLASLLSNDSVSASDTLSEAVYRLRDAYSAAADAARDLAGQGASAALGEKELPALGTIGPVLSGGGRLINEAELQDQRAQNTKSQTQIEAERAARSRGGGGRGGSVSEAEREREAVAKLIDELEFERSLIGLSALERERAVALRRAGSAATDEQRLKIAELVTAVEEETEAFKGAEEAAKFFKETLGGALLSIIPPIETGNRALDNLLNTLIQVVAQAALLGQGPLAGLIGGGGGLLSLFGFAKGGIASHGRPQPLPMFARGGVSRSAAIFGEAGPEAAVPLPDGRRIPVDLRVPAMPRQRSTSISMPVTIDARDANAPALARVNEQLREMQRNLPREIDNRINTRDVRGTRP